MKKIIIGLLLIIIIMIAGAGADGLSPNDPQKIKLEDRYLNSNREYPLGTDAYGRCILSRLLYGTRYSIGLALVVMTGVVAITIPAGMAAAYRGKIADKVFLWLCDISMALPPTVLVLAVMGLIGNGMVNLIFSTLFSYLGWYGRLVRSAAAAELAKEYITYAVTGGAGGFTILAKHVFPNIFSGLLVLFVLGIGDTILMLSSYSFLGIGLPAGVPEWGAMLNEAKSLLLQSPRYVIYPGLCVLITVVAFNLLGEGLRGRLAIKGRGVEYE